jgi:hypothetical protein
MFDEPIFNSLIATGVVSQQNPRLWSQECSDHKNNEKQLRTYLKTHGYKDSPLKIAAQSPQQLYKTSPTIALIANSSKPCLALSHPNLSAPRKRSSCVSSLQRSIKMVTESCRKLSCWKATLKHELRKMHTRQWIRSWQRLMWTAQVLSITVSS